VKSGIVASMSQNPDRQPLDACVSRDARPATRDDLLRQPEDRAFELVGGVLVAREVAGLDHGRAQLKLGMGVGPFDRRLAPRSPARPPVGPRHSPRR
jgi:hypothetical protein